MWTIRGLGALGAVGGHIGPRALNADGKSALPPILHLSVANYGSSSDDVCDEINSNFPVVPIFENDPSITGVLNGSFTPPITLGH